MRCWLPSCPLPAGCLCVHLCKFLNAVLAGSCRRETLHEHDVTESQKSYNSVVFNAFIFMQVSCT